MPERSDQLFAVHTVSIINDSNDRCVSAGITEDLNLRCFCRDAVVDQVRDCGFQRISEVSERCRQAGGAWREWVMSCHQSTSPGVRPQQLHFAEKEQNRLRSPLEFAEEIQKTSQRGKQLCKALLSHFGVKRNCSAFHVLKGRS